MLVSRTISLRENNVYILRTAEGFEKCSQNGDRVGYIPLEYNISNWSKVAYLKTKVDMSFFTIKHCQNFTFARGHGAGVTMEKCIRMELCFFLCVCFNPLFISSFFSLFPPFSFAFSCAFRLLDHLSRTWLALTGQHCEGTPINRKWSKNWSFFSYFGSLSRPSFTC